MGDPQKGCIVAQGVESFFVDDAIQLADVHWDRISMSWAC